MSSRRPKVSIGVLTYNHAKFIGEALDSILSQEVDFDYDIVVADDASTDGAQDIIREYARRHPGVFRLHLREKNIGGMANFVHLMSEVNGQYVTFLDGDDWWTSKEKLAAQVRFLDENPDFTLCFHDARVENGPNLSAFCPEGLSEYPTFEELVSLCFVPFCSAVYRHEAIRSIPEWWMDLNRRYSIGDWTLHVVATERGKMRYFRETWAAYRVHGDGIWSVRKAPAKFEALVGILEFLNRHYDYRYDRSIRPSLVNGRFALAVQYVLAGRKLDALRSIGSGFRDIGKISDWRARLSVAHSGAYHFTQPLVLASLAYVPRSVKTRAKQVIGQARGLAAHAHGGRAA